ncbi:MAG: phosphatase PAP2 family protein [Treponema sp.]|jgi:membrane-associated phospholipid phosphatase|nr:phosphatase PAP2 family protein [Treponema sp.]
MENMLQWGLDCIRAVQNAASPPLTVVMNIVTWFGSTWFWFTLLPLVFWYVDEKKGVRLGVAVMVSAWLNITLKFLFNQPRPFWEGYDPRLAFIPEGLNGFPSGHAQATLVIWIIMASWVGKKWAYAAAALVVLLISFSRVYLGVHFPTDILGGWIAGSLVLAVYFLWGDAIERLLVRGGLRAQIIVSAAAAFIMILYNPAVSKTMQGGVEALVSPGGIVLGMGVGYALSACYTGFHSSFAGRTGAAKFLAAAGRIVIGAAGTALFFILLQKMKIVLGPGFNRFGIFIQFAVSALWIYGGAPWIFVLLKLADGKSKEGKAA